MATISENLQILKNSTDAIKQAIIDKGCTIEGDITTWASAISGISGGGGNVSTNSFARLIEIGYTNEEIKSIENQFYDDLEYSKALLDAWDVNNESADYYYSANYWVKHMPLIDTSNVTSMNGMFSGCSSLVSIPQLDTSNVEYMDEMFSYCTALTTISQLNTSKVTSMYAMFRNVVEAVGPMSLVDNYKDYNTGPALTTIPQFDTSNVVNMEAMFEGCTALTTIPQLDTSNVEYMDLMFNGCTSLTTIPQLDTSNVVGMSSMFNGCTSLTTIPQLDTSKVEDMFFMFQNCISLEHITSIDMSSVEYTNYIFSSCDALVFVLIKNIGKSSATTFDLSGANNWGTGSNENRQSLIDSLITYSYDRSSNGLPSATIKLSSTTKDLLTEAEIAQITAKGFTIS